MDTSEIRSFFDALNRDYLAVHTKKEELYWAIRMATSEEHERFAEAEVAYKSFVSDPARLAAVRERIARLEAKPGAALADEDPSAELLSGLRGWQALFEANVVEGEEGRTRMARSSSSRPLSSSVAGPWNCATSTSAARSSRRHCRAS